MDNIQKKTPEELNVVASLTDETNGWTTEINVEVQNDYVNLTNDLMFHMVFTKNKKALKGLLSCLLKIPKEEILDIVILNPIQYNESINTKTTILDLKLYLNNNRYVLVEMQVRDFEYWTNRILIYGCRQINDQANGTNAYMTLEPVIQISIMKHSLFPARKRFYSEYRIQDNEGQVLTDKLSFAVLDLSSIPDAKTVKPEEKELVDWANAFIAPDWKTLMTIDNESVKEAVRTMEMIMKNPAERQLIWDHQMALWDFESQMDSAERRGKEQGIAIGEARGKEQGIAIGEARGKEQGIAIGEARGKEQGIAIGEAQGRMEERYKIAKNMKAHQHSDEMIHQVTGLPFSEIEQL
ncbi:MAG: Rpn family recombination-promoting nuclease/putative transposase [Clostridia bacterium]|nr:Rpn family recombination-promoting nuclease/putative transposase [Clostridia bacterium]